VRSSLGKRFKARSSRFTWLLTIKLANAPLSLARKRDCDENRSAGALLRATTHASFCSQVCDYNSRLLLLLYEPNQPCRSLLAARPTYRFEKQVVRALSFIAACGPGDLEDTRRSVPNKMHIVRQCDNFHVCLTDRMGVGRGKYLPPDFEM